MTDKRNYQVSSQNMERLLALSGKAFDIVELSEDIPSELRDVVVAVAEAIVAIKVEQPVEDQSWWQQYVRDYGDPT